MEQIRTLDSSTLGELRRLVDATRDLPDEAPVRARVRATWSANGAPITRVHIGEAK